ncbi:MULTISPECIES: hypothetical protein [unclassified Tolypothrix]|uniref:hypothetical protein n=1 Tax=unclassified Tolypothrix TaxID=2649714 RepID=UPI0005EAA97A|nr:MULTISPECIES: hypothetical protein [unclassified Tolypothrix]BAY89926.1 hypothetical protein NIES3275_19300 [Microchaete diplosiphon NIES-3275]EKE96960.1 hypothetical protein FDUTEX481_06159 [Tolypothrix sp. PCC 7601]MBE9082133.1 hypothetical protein [Tolypothrix sp. LEGE 11397]UYD24162.1 hypothetical protein HGR01_22035 [Tolypothrix sp. PCC 7712]UYD33608.1 hypothetical protein HG267_32675 [Tolypothrix sp. PCC 7601]
MHYYRAILKQVGIVLIAMGMLDLMYMVYRVFTVGSNASDQSYSSPGILIVVAGVYLIRGSLRTANIVRWIAAFGIASGLGSILMRSFSTPIALLTLEFRLEPSGFSMWYLSRIVETAVAYWIYRQLSAAPVMSVSRNSSLAVSIPKQAFFLGAGLTVLMPILLYITGDGLLGRKAVTLARAKYGTSYNYHVTALRWSSKNVSANITAYNDKEIKTVRVELK